MGVVEWFGVEKSGRARVESRSVERWWCTQCDFGGGNRGKRRKERRGSASVGVFCG